MNVLLDTCAFISLAMPQGRLSAAATEAINDPNNRLFLSDVSLWEITLKHSSGKLPLPAIPREWVPLQMQFHCLERWPLD